MTHRNEVRRVRGPRRASARRGLWQAAAAGLLMAAIGTAHAADKRPNILLIVADDLGYSDLGAFGGEIETPNLDQLAAEGRRLTAFYTSPTCSPTRSALFSGTDHHLAGLGSMEGELTAPNQKGKPGYEGYLNDRVLSLAELLKDGGYRTYMAGKWHLGSDPGHQPQARGFEKSFALLGGAANHYQQPTYMRASYVADGVPVKVPADFYSTDFYTDKLISFIEQGRKDGQPFFAFAAYTSPHWPLQAPARHVDKYRGKYDAGYEAVRAQRIARQKRLGLLADTARVSPALPETADLPTWPNLLPEQRQAEARRMEIYAGMVDNLDHNIGRLLTYLKDSGEYDNTLVLFFSDNGAEPHTVPNFIPPTADNSYANLGKPNSFVAYGPRWAEVGATPYRLAKGYTTEGGVRTPAILRHPQLTRDNHGNADQLVAVTDVAPTLLDFAGVANPGKQYKGRSVHPISGTSIVPYVKGEQKSPHPKGHVLAEELFGQRSVRKDDWKAVWLSPPTGPGLWQLYNVASDPGETRDLADERPEKLSELLWAWADYVDKNGVILPQGKNVYLDAGLKLAK